MVQAANAKKALELARKRELVHVLFKIQELEKAQKELENAQKEAANAKKALELARKRELIRAHLKKQQPKKVRFAANVKVFNGSKREKVRVLWKEQAELKILKNIVAKLKRVLE